MARPSATDFKEYKFKINAYSRERMPMRYLAEYLSELAVLFGEEAHVHFDRLENGSTQAVARVENEADSRVRDRLHSVKRNEGPADAIEAYDKINKRLRKDNTDGILFEPDDRKVLIFPGIKEVKPPEFGPFTQADTLEGIPIMIGGERSRVPIHLEGRDNEILICYAQRSLAKKIAAYLFTSVIRVDGNARYFRDSDGNWQTKYFSASGFNPVREGTLADDLDRLRAIPAAWKGLDDPLAELTIIRNDQ